MQTFREWLNEKEGKETYKDFFTKKLEKYGVKSASELSGEDKKKFFDEVDAEWEGENEEPEAGDVNESVDLVKFNMENIGNPLILSEDGDIDKNKIVLHVSKDGWFKIFDIKSSNIVDYSPNGKKSDSTMVDKAIIQIVSKFVK